MFAIDNCRVEGKKKRGFRNLTKNQASEIASQMILVRLADRLDQAQYDTASFARCSLPRGFGY